MVGSHYPSRHRILCNTLSKTRRFHGLDEGVAARRHPAIHELVHLRGDLEDTTPESPLRPRVVRRKRLGVMSRALCPFFNLKVWDNVVFKDLAMRQARGPGKGHCMSAGMYVSRVQVRPFSDGL